MLEMLMLYMSLIETEEEKVKFEKIYVQYRKLMYVCAKEILHSDHLAEDAVHEAFLKIAKYLDKIEFPCNKTKRFVVIVVENAAKDIYRKEKHRMHLDLEAIETSYHFPVIDGVEEMTDVEKAILKLPLTYRQIFQMKYAWGFPNKEIAQILNMKEGTLRQRIMRGKGILREILKEMEVYIDEEYR